jgi:carbon-monoxide dehydrogenase small subunit
MSGPVTLKLRVNGRALTLSAPPMKRLLDVLREEAQLTGAKEGCGEGECGACSVLLDGVPVNSCLVPFGQCEGARITTVEGLARGRRLGALQQAFVEMGGSQCGICTPGMLIAATALLDRKPGRVPSDDEVRTALAGNLCRCTGYQRIIDAVRAAARPVTAKKPRVGAKKKASKPQAARSRPGRAR